jgi:hypothetical protein
VASAQVINGGGGGSNNCSIWCVTWSDAATTLLYPQGTAGGINREDKGTQRVLDGSGNSYYVKEEVFRAHCGLAVKDWRYNARICNINATNRDAGSVDLYALLRKMFYSLQGVYQTALKSGDGKLNPSASAEGRTVRGIPIEVTDALLDTEAAVA